MVSLTNVEQANPQPDSLLLRVVRAYFTQPASQPFTRHCVAYNDFLELTGLAARLPHPDIWAICSYDTGGGYLVQQHRLEHILFREMLAGALGICAIPAAFSVVFVLSVFGVGFEPAAGVAVAFLIGSIVIAVAVVKPGRAEIKACEWIQFPENLTRLLAEIKKEIDRGEKKILIYGAIASAVARVAPHGAGVILEAVVEKSLEAIVERVQEIHLERHRETAIHDAVDSSQKSGMA